MNNPVDSRRPGDDPFSDQALKAFLLRKDLSAICTRGGEQCEEMVRKLLEAATAHHKSGDTISADDEAGRVVERWLSTRLRDAIMPLRKGRASILAAFLCVTFFGFVWVQKGPMIFTKDQPTSVTQQEFGKSLAARPSIYGGRRADSVDHIPIITLEALDKATTSAPVVNLDELEEATPIPAVAITP